LALISNNMFRFLTDRSLAFKMSLYVLTASTIIFIGLLYYNLKISKKIMLKNLVEYTDEIKSATSNSIEQILQQNENFAYTFKELMEGTQLSREHLESFMNDAVMAYDFVYGCSIFFEPYSFDKDSMAYAPCCYDDREKKMVHYQNLASVYKGKDSYFNQKWYLRAKYTKIPFWTRPYKDTIINNGKLLLDSYVLPFYRNKKDTNNYKGTIVIDISLEWFNKYLSDIKPFDSSFIFLTTHDRSIISHPDTSFIMKGDILTLKEYKGLDYLKTFGDSLRKLSDSDFKAHYIQVVNTISQEKGYVIYWSIEHTGWIIALYVPEKVLLKDLYTLTYSLVGFTFLGIVLLFVVIIIIAKRFTKPIKKLSEITNEIGHGNFNVKLPYFKTKDEVGVLNKAIFRMQNSLKLYVQHIEESTSAKERIESELQIARNIQMGILPKKFPPFPNIKNFEIYAFLEEARDVGGDLYDFFMLSHNRLCIAIGDVSGKGVPAAMFMAIARTLLRSKASYNSKAQDIIMAMNRSISNENENFMFVTFAVGILDIYTGDFEYCSAGHNPPFISQQGGDFSMMDVRRNIPLGIDGDYRFYSNNTVLKNSDIFYIYSDGITEAMDNKGDFYTEERLAKALNITKNESIPNLIKNIKKDVDSYVKGADQSDDMTMLAIKFISSDETNFITENIIISNNIHEIHTVANFIHQVGNQYLFSQKILFELNLVIEELVTNTISYGYKDLEVHEIKLNLFLSKDNVTIELIDDALEFNPFLNDVPDSIEKPIEEREIGGLGIYFVTSYVDEYKYERIDNVNIITLVKKIEYNLD